MFEVKLSTDYQLVTNKMATIQVLGNYAEFIFGVDSQPLSSTRGMAFYSGNIVYNVDNEKLWVKKDNGISEVSLFISEMEA